MFFFIGGLCSLGCPGCFLGTSWEPIHNYVVFIILGNTPNCVSCSTNYPTGAMGFAVNKSLHLGLGWGPCVTWKWQEIRRRSKALNKQTYLLRLCFKIDTSVQAIQQTHSWVNDAPSQTWFGEVTNDKVAHTLYTCVCKYMYIHIVLDLVSKMPRLPISTR